MSLVLKDSSLAVCSAEKLTDGMWNDLEWLKGLAEGVEERSEPFALRADLERHKSSWLNEYVTCYAPGIYSVRFLDPGFCAKLLEVINTIPFTPNDEEPVDAQIPEVIIKHHHYGLHECLRGLHNAVIAPLTMLLMGHSTGRCESIQAAKYTPSNTPKGCWHTDQDSELTCVVALSDGHEGGGTEVYLGPYHGTVTVPQLPVGHAMLFNGRHFPHRGLPVTKGERNLLVHWFKIED